MTAHSYKGKYQVHMYLRVTFLILCFVFLSFSNRENRNDYE